MGCGGCPRSVRGAASRGAGSTDPPRSVRGVEFGGQHEACGARAAAAAQAVHSHRLAVDGFAGKEEGQRGRGPAARQAAGGDEYRTLRRLVPHSPALACARRRLLHSRAAWRHYLHRTARRQPARTATRAAHHSPSPLLPLICCRKASQLRSSSAACLRFAFCGGAASSACARRSGRLDWGMGGAAAKGGAAAVQWRQQPQQRQRRWQQRGPPPPHRQGKAPAARAPVSGW